MCECLTTCILVLNDDSKLQAVFNFFLLVKLKTPIEKPRPCKSVNVYIIYTASTPTINKP